MDKKEIIGFPAKKSVGLLLDPDKSGKDTLKDILRVADESRTDYILAGGSLSHTGIDKLIDNIKEISTLPVILFPGNLLQISLKADLILFLSLISGRNPELLIGNHVIAAPLLKNSGKKIIPTGYILIGCGSKTSVEYMSQTEAIPSSRPDIAVATALAGEMLGLRAIYLEAGSGAEHHVPAEVIIAVRQSVSLPVIVGGGIRNEDEAENIFLAGADMIVLGNGCEKNPDLLRRICRVRDKLRKQAYPLA